MNAFFLLPSGYTAPPYTVIKCAFSLPLPIASGAALQGQISLIFLEGEISVVEREEDLKSGDLKLHPSYVTYGKSLNPSLS